MPKFLIERELQGAGALSGANLREIADKSNCVLRSLGPTIQWIQSYVTSDALYCVYIAPDEQLIRDHAAQGGFPVTRISQISQTIDPATAEA